MSDVIRAPKTVRREGPHGTAPGGRLARGDWTPRGAIMFWVVASGLVWIALAASAIWIY